MEKILWSPKVRREKLWELYQSDAQGALDEELLAEVGYGLLARCQSILMIREGLVTCPRCGMVFRVVEPGQPPDSAPVSCPGAGCGWQVTTGEYHLSKRHRELMIGKAGPAFETYMQRFPRAKTLQERMFAIDRLIHDFHWELNGQLPNRPAANNLIEGSLKQVIDLLNQLSYGDDEGAKTRWRETVAIMMKRRRGK